MIVRNRRDEKINRENNKKFLQYKQKQVIVYPI